MRPLSEAALLAAVDAAALGGALERPLALLAAASGGGDAPEALAALPLCERDRRLLELRRAALGASLAAYVECPGCGERLEISAAAAQVAGAPVAADAAWEAEGGGVRMRFRLPDSRDLAAAAHAGELEAARRVLAARCVVEALDAQGAPVAELPEAAVAALAARMDQVAPTTHVSLELRCPACSHAWTPWLDVAGFVWTELSARARRLLREVDALARAYHWSEDQILALPPARRRAYLELARG